MDELKWKRLRKMAILSRGGSRRERARTGQEFDKARTDKNLMLTTAYAMGIPIRRTPKRRGRPHKCRIW